MDEAYLIFPFLTNQENPFVLDYGWKAFPEMADMAFNAESFDIIVDYLASECSVSLSVKIPELKAIEMRLSEFNHSCAVVGALQRSHAKKILDQDLSNSDIERIAMLYNSPQKLAHELHAVATFLRKCCVFLLDTPIYYVIFVSARRDLTMRELSKKPIF